MVYSDLGGGSNGHIDIILSPDKYNFISLSPIIWPLHPILLVIIDGTTQLIITEIQTQHKKLIRYFKEFLPVEADLRQQIITYVDVN